MKGELNKRFEMKDLGEAQVWIGLEIRRNRVSGELWLGQLKYAASVLDRFNMSNCNPSLTPMKQHRISIGNTSMAVAHDSPTNAPYRQAIGCLMFLMVGTHPDLAYAIGKLSQHCSDPRESYWTAVKRVFRYLPQTKHMGIVFTKRKSEPHLVGFSDADWGGCLESRKSTSGYVFQICGGAVSWSSRKQTVVATSSCEAEYVALCEACKEASWLRSIVADILGLKKDPTLPLACDNNGTIAISHNQSINRRNKHIDIAYHFVRDAIRREVVNLKQCDTSEMTADIFTKPLGRVLFQKFVGYLGLRNSTDPKSM